MMVALNWICTHWIWILDFGGTVLGFIGGILMANRFFSNITFLSKITALLSALFGGNVANANGFVADINEERATTSLRGIAFIVFGFACQAIAKCAEFFVSPPHVG